MDKGLVKAQFLPLILLYFITAGCSNPRLGQEGIQRDKAIDNVVFIIGDDHATGVLGAYGNQIIRTPNLDQLASEGVLFTNAFANSPMCSASRQSILTGKYPPCCGSNSITHLVSG
jgi:arylsulfatase A-like enzyme